MTSSFHLRPYRAADEDAAIELWRRTWQLAYPSIDFAARVAWWRTRWRNELVPNARIVVAEQAAARDQPERDAGGKPLHSFPHPALAGFVTIDANGYLDQLVVAPEKWGSQLATALVDEARRLSPSGVTLLVNEDNARAIRFYARNGFAQDGRDVNPTSGRPVLRMAWRPSSA
ncbi:MAG: GNAT family N-acetyltransferase [Xanthobacteraceae bacterium]|nr:GNAT family N-acetyltransferase [Xanthobacteraceae bacterium]